MGIVDQSGLLSPEDLDELDIFIQDHLLSRDTDRAFLGQIRIHNRDSNDHGAWDVSVKFSPEGSLISLVAVITLNIYHFRGLHAHERLTELKTVLAHEYGHHWTLIYLYASQRMTDHSFERLPEAYYLARALSKEYFTCNYDYSLYPLHWHRCDKEIIAEDYRVLFAPYPYNQNHQMVEHPVLQLDPPSQVIADYIQSLENLA
jgi:hypothetical protein